MSPQVAQPLFGVPDTPEKSIEKGCIDSSLYMEQRRGDDNPLLGKRGSQTHGSWVFASNIGMVGPVDKVKQGRG